METYVHTKTYTWTLIVTSFIIAQNLNTTPMSSEWWMDKTTVVPLCNEVLVSNTKEWTTDTHLSIDESQKHYPGRKKSVKKGYILNGCCIHKFSKQVRWVYRDEKQVSGCLELLVGVELTRNVYKGNIWGAGNAFISKWLHGVCICQTHQAVYIYCM